LPGSADTPSAAAAEHAGAGVVAGEAADRFTAGAAKARGGDGQAGLEVVVVLVLEVRLGRAGLEVDGGAGRAGGGHHGARAALVAVRAQGGQRPLPVGVAVAGLGGIWRAAQGVREQCGDRGTIAAPQVAPVAVLPFGAPFPAAAAKDQERRHDRRQPRRGVSRVGAVHDDAYHRSDLRRSFGCARSTAERGGF
jgi:hypothetical protein